MYIKKAALCNKGIKQIKGLKKEERKAKNKERN